MIGARLEVGGSRTFLSRRRSHCRDCHPVSRPPSSWRRDSMPINRARAPISLTSPTCWGSAASPWNMAPRRTRRSPRCFTTRPRTRAGWQRLDAFGTGSGTRLPISSSSAPTVSTTRPRLGGNARKAISPRSRTKRHRRGWFRSPTSSITRPRSCGITGNMAKHCGTASKGDATAFSGIIVPSRTPFPISNLRR